MRERKWEPGEVRCGHYRQRGLLLQAQRQQRVPQQQRLGQQLPLDVNNSGG